MAVMEELKVPAGYYPDVFIVRGPIAKAASENAVFAPFAKPIFGTYSMSYDSICLRMPMKIVPIY